MRQQCEKRTMQRARTALELKTLFLGRNEERKTLWYRPELDKDTVIADYCNQNHQLAL